MAAPLTLPLFPSLAPDAQSAAAPTLKTKPEQLPQPAPGRGVRHSQRVRPESTRRKMPRAALAQRPPGPELQPRANVLQLWLAVQFPRLALDALEGTAAGDGRQPLAILDPEDRVQSVLACNDAAHARGVRAGQPLNAALAFDSTLLTLPRDAFRERQFLERIAAQCQRFTPVVSLAGVDELLLEVKGSLHLFGGAVALLERVRGELRQVRSNLALTPTPQAALWLARSGGGESPCVLRPEELAASLSPLPLACLRWPEEILERLVNMGVRDLGDLARLPRAGLARRIGVRWLGEIDRAFGRHADVRRRFEPRTRYDHPQALDCEIETTAGLQAVLAPLLAHLQRFLRAREAALDALALDLRHRAGPATRVRLGLAAATGDVEHLRGLLEERLATLALRAPVIAVRLRSGALRAAQAVPARLPYAHATSAARAVMPDALPRLVERLQARLGREAVFGLGLFREHRPELAWRATEFPREPSQPGGAATAPRPVWLLAEPDPLRPARWRIESGPERIESGWWDGGDVARDYFVARDPHGVRGWVYRERRAPHRWFLHGLFG